jgi:L-seryl-tRNA(Ser) seleniumtransferase
MNEPVEALRQIPPVNDVLRAPQLSAFAGVLNQPFVSGLLDQILSGLRRDLARQTTPVSRADLTEQIANRLAAQIREVLRPSLRRVINASGVVLHTNLGRAPLPVAAIEHLRDVSIGYSNLEFDIESGSRGKRDVHVDSLLQRLTACEAAIVVNNNAAAVLLVLNSLGEGGEVIASRGEQVEIGGSFRIPEVMAKSGATLREVGTTNRTRIKDYERAIGEHTRLLLRVHPSNFRMTGFTERPSLEEFAGLGKRRNIATFEDLGSGCILPLDAAGIHGEPVVMDSIRAGVDVVSFSGDKLLGGPQAGIIAGKKLLVEKIRQNPLFRALRIDKLTLSVLEVVLRSYLEGVPEDVPVWLMLNTPEPELMARAENFAGRAGKCARAVRIESLVGGGSAPESMLPSWGVVLESEKLSETEMEKRFRTTDPPVIVRVENGRIVLDMRTIFPAEEEKLLRIVAQVIS